MKTNELPKDCIWNFNPETKSFSVEMSTLQGNGDFTRITHENGKPTWDVRGPTGACIDFERNFKPQTDGEGDTTHWVYTRGDFTYNIWND